MTNKYTPHKHAEVICAWAQGKPIQYYCPNEQKWKYLTDPSWFENMQYRVKPETKYVTKYKIADYNTEHGYWFLTEDYWESVSDYVNRPLMNGKYKPDLYSPVLLANTVKLFEVPNE